MCIYLERKWECRTSMVTIRDKWWVFIYCTRVKQKERWCSRLSKSVLSFPLSLSACVSFFSFSFIRKSSPYYIDNRMISVWKSSFEQLLSLWNRTILQRKDTSNYTYTFSYSLLLLLFCMTSSLAATLHIDAARHIDKCNHVNTSALTLFPMCLLTQQPLMMSTFSCRAWIFLSSQERDKGETKNALVMSI
jgi:hypothetical protein